VVKLLLETGKVEVDARDSEYNQTPLSWAAENGHDGVVELLLETGKVDVDARDKRSRTPLSWAAENGHVDVVKLLLETGNVDVDARDSEHNQTPLSWAAENGHDGVVKLLLETGRVDVNAEDKRGLTPVSWAVEKGHGEVVKLLLETGKSTQPIGPALLGSSERTRRNAKWDRRPSNKPTLHPFIASPHILASSGENMAKSSQTKQSLRRDLRFDIK